MSEIERNARNAAIVYLYKSGFDIDTIAGAVFCGAWIVRAVLKERELLKGKDGSR